MFSWEDISKYKAERAFLPGTSPDYKTFFSPRDDLHSLLADLLKGATLSVVCSMFGYDDEDLNRIIQNKLDSEHIFVQLSLDSTQAAGVHEREILKKWKAEELANSVAVGRSARGAISHVKLVVVDGIFTISGSTNWSKSGETLQDNELTISKDAVRAAQFRSEADKVHDLMKEQMFKRLNSNSS